MNEREIKTTTGEGQNGEGIYTMKKLVGYLLVSLFMIGCSSGLSWSAETVSGTNWRILQDDEHISVYSFNPDGSCTYYIEGSPSGNQGKIFTNCEWIQNDSVLTFNVNGHFFSVIAIIEGKILNGFYVSNLRNARGSFKGKKVD